MLIPTIVLSACAPKTEPVKYSSSPIEKPALILPQVSTLSLSKVDYIIVTKENADGIFADLEKNGKPVVLIAVDINAYEALSLNMARILELVSQQKNIIAAYERYYVETTSIIDNHNERQ